MTKKIILLFVCLIMLVSCGRKNDPKYEANNQFIIIKKV
tara:strand:+ start:78 stop:194 length:117 start_codon:yes stop_codon:yes gene_type:complete